MKFSLLICLLLLAAVSPKRENKFKPFNFVTKTLLSTSEYGDGEDYNEDPCQSQTTQKDCLATSTGVDYLQCCYMISNIQIPEEVKEEVCSVNVKPFGPLASLINAGQFMSFFREIYGFTNFGLRNEEDYSSDNMDIKGSFEVKCKDSSAKKSVDFKKYTDDEIKILSSENYCLYDIYQKIENISEPMSLSATKCESLSLLPSSKKNGLECANLKLTISSEVDVTLNSCIIYNRDFYSKIRIPDEYAKFIEEYMSMSGVNFKIEIENSKGSKFSYDSETGKLINKSSFASISKCLLILFGLILF